MYINLNPYSSLLKIHKDVLYESFIINRIIATNTDWIGVYSIRNNTPSQKVVSCECSAQRWGPRRMLAVSVNEVTSESVGHNINTFKLID